MLFLSEVIAYIYKMSLLLNNVSLNNFTQTPFFNFEKEEENNGKKCGKLSAFKTKQKLVDNQILFFSEAKNDNNKSSTIKLLNQKYLKNYFNFLKLSKKKKSKEFIQYIINLSTLKKNTTIHVTDVKGHLKLFCSASFSLKLSGKQKTFQPKVLIALVKYLLDKTCFLKNNVYFYNKDSLPIAIAIHAKNIRRRKHLKFVATHLKKEVDIKTIKVSNFYPHNGCRSKKTKRFKRRKKNKTVKNIFFHNTNSEKKIWKLFFKPNKKNRTFKNDKQ